MDKRLYTVMVYTEEVVVASSREEAERIASQADLSIWEYNASPLRCLPPGWNGGEIPWAHIDEPQATVDEWIARGAAPGTTNK
jgi:hypothetical protein